MYRNVVSEAVFKPLLMDIEGQLYINTYRQFSIIQIDGKSQKSKKEIKDNLVNPLHYGLLLLLCFVFCFERRGCHQCSLG